MYRPTSLNFPKEQITVRDRLPNDQRYHQMSGHPMSQMLTVRSVCLPEDHSVRHHQRAEPIQWTVRLLADL